MTMIDESSTRVKIGNYVMGKTLGVGSFGKVKLAEHLLTTQLVAIKIVNRGRMEVMGVSAKISREIKILQRFVHPHIIRLYDIIETPSDFFLVLEYGDGGELFDYIVSQGKLPEDEARKYFQQIVSGVAYCHEHGIAHRDLKPENLLLTEDHNIKVADFGLSNVMLDGQFLRTSCGSPNYAAPEVISGFFYAGPEIDVWSCGVILYALLCGALPFDDDEIPKLFKKIKSGWYNMPSHLSQPAQDIISKVLLVEPLKRLTINEVRLHPWFVEKLPKYLSLPVKEQGVLKADSNNNVGVAEVDEELVRNICNRKDIRYVSRTGPRGVIKAIKSSVSNEVKTIYNLEYDRKQKHIREQMEVQNRLKQSNKNKASKAGPVSDDNTMLPSSRSNDIFIDRMDLDLTTNNSARNHSSFGNVYIPPSVSPFARNLLSSMRPNTLLESSNLKRRRWYLGIQSKKEADVVIKEVFRAIASLGFEWSFQELYPYRITCRLRNDFAVDVKKQWVYLRLQLFRVQNGIYLLDFQKLGEGLSSFKLLQLCSQIINRLKPPAPSKTKD